MEPPGTGGLAVSNGGRKSANAAVVAGLIAAVFAGCSSTRLGADRRGDEPAAVESRLRHELADSFSVEKALRLVRALIEQQKTREARDVLVYVSGSGQSGRRADLQIRSLLAEIYYREERIADSVLELREILSSYPERRGWVEGNFDFITRQVSRKAAYLRTTADERIALGLIASSGDYPGPAKILAKVYESQIGDTEISVAFLQIAAACGRPPEAAPQHSPEMSACLRWWGWLSQHTFAHARSALDLLAAPTTSSGLPGQRDRP